MKFIIKIFKWIYEAWLSSGQEPSRNSQKETGLLWYPNAVIKDFKNITRGNYKNNYPIGAVIHFTSGRFENDMEDAINTGIWMAKEGYGSFIITRTGKVIQSAPLDKWCYHAGESYNEELGKSLSSKLVGIEIQSAGLLDKIKDDFYPWWDRKNPIPKENVRYDALAVVPGYYHKYTTQQEKALLDLLCWLKSNNPDVFSFNHVLGHDEIAIPKGRKSDPGGCLSMPMSAYRNFLDVEYYSANR